MIILQVHTFELKCMVTNQLYYQLQDRIKLENGTWTHTKDTILYWGLCDSGIIIELQHIKKEGLSNYWIVYRISARRMFEASNYVGLFDCSKIKRLIDRADELLSSFSALLPGLRACSLSRLDFCTNLVLEDQQQVKAYIKLMRRGALPKGFSRKEYYDKTAKRKKPLRDDFTICRKANMELSIYNKYRQMKKEMERNKKLDFPDIEQAKNIVRIELRCLPGKLSQLRKKYKLQHWTELFDRAGEIGAYLYEFYLPKLFGRGDFYTLKELRDRIAISGFSHKEREGMLEFVEEATVCRSLDTAKGCLYGTCFNGKMKRLLYKFDLIAASPVAVPREERKRFPPEEPIPNPLALLQEAWARE